MLVLLVDKSAAVLGAYSWSLLVIVAESTIDLDMS